MGSPRTGTATGSSSCSSSFPTAPYLVSARTVRALRLLFEVDGLHPKEPHWYLATLGTAPNTNTGASARR